MISWITNVVERLRKSDIPLAQALPLLLDPSEPRGCIRPVGDDWLCPFTCARIHVPEWDGSSLTLLDQPAVVDHLMHAPLLKERRLETPMQSWEELLSITFMLRLRHLPKFQRTTSTGEWICPYCQTGTGAVYREWDGSAAPVGWFLPQALAHVAGCSAYIADPLDGAQDFPRADRVFSRELMDRIAAEPIFLVADDHGNWMCPFSLEPIRGITVGVKPGPATFNKIAEHLMSHECPGRQVQWQPAVSLLELHRAAGRASASNAYQRGRATIEKELAFLRARVSELTHDVTFVQRVKKELRSARMTQLKMLPDTPPALEGFDISAFYQPSADLGGDFYHFPAAAGDRTGFLIGDVSGQGIDAALIMSAALRSFAVHGAGEISPTRLLNAIHRDLLPDLQRGKFVSAFYATIDHAGATLRWARAGHNPGILLRPDGSHELLRGAGVAIGIGSVDLFSRMLQEHETDFSPGSILLLYTDGVTEAMDEAGEEFGEQRLIASLTRYADLDAKKLLNRIMDDVQKFGGERLPGDDCTMLVVKRAQ